MGDGGLQQWWYEEGGQPKGPVGAEKLRAMVQAGVLSPATQILRTGSVTWGTLAEHADELNLSDSDRTPQPAAAAETSSPAGLQSLRQLQAVSNGRRFAGFIVELGLMAVTLFIGWLLWSIAIWPQGLTPAKQLLGMRVMDLETRQVATSWKMATREVIAKLLLQSFTFGITTVVSCFMVLFTDQHRTIWDRMADTIVVDERTLDDIAAPGRGSALQPIGWSLIGLSLLVAFTALFSGQNGTDPAQESGAVYTFLVAVVLAAGGIGLVWKARRDRG